MYDIKHISVLLYFLHRQGFPSSSSADNGNITTVRSVDRCNLSTVHSVNKGHLSTVRSVNKGN
jgi:hypothetical protein